MNSQDNVRKFPKVIYDKLNQETEKMVVEKLSGKLYL